MAMKPDSSDARFFLLLAIGVVLLAVWYGIQLLMSLDPELVEWRSVITFGVITLTAISIYVLMIIGAKKLDRPDRGIMHEKRISSSYSPPNTRVNTQRVAIIAILLSFIPIIGPITGLIILRNARNGSTLVVIARIICIAFLVSQTVTVTVPIITILTTIP